MDRRALLPVMSQALALPRVPVETITAPAANAITQEELKEAFRYHDGQLMTAEGLNARWQILIDLFFEVDPDKLPREVG